MSNYAVIAAGQNFNIGTRVVLWNEPTGFSFYKNGKYIKRDKTIEKLQNEINCFVLHHSVDYKAKNTYNNLRSRGLSVNFIIDDDATDGIATIYQCLDIKDAGYSHKPLNLTGPGVEISYHPEAWEKPNLYSEKNRQKYKVSEHKTLKDTVHSQTRTVFAPTDAQVQACIALAYGISQAFPNMKMEFPKNANGEIIKTTVADPKGLLCHFHITKQKIDPAGFPCEYMEEQVKVWNKLGF